MGEAGGVILKRAHREGGGADRAKRERRSMGGEAENEELNRGRKIEPAEEGRNLGMKGCRI